MAADPLTGFLNVINTAIDKAVPDAGAKDAAKLKVFEMVQNGEITMFTAKADVIKTEAASEHFLAAAWRPITMLTFTALIVARWFGLAAPDLSEAEYIKLWDIVELGLGGYVMGRTAEKIVPSLAGVLKK